VHPGKESHENYRWVDSIFELRRMVDELRSEKELAVDLEHHSYRSFLGFTCLIQVSSRKFDYIVDAISLREHLHALNPLFSNPAVLKVFHGADMDVKWLQRDFGVYVVNLFDTHKAVQQLGRSPYTFVSLLFRYANEVTDKEFQLADWRVRPLTAEMTKYARRDTHYLLFIYDCLRRDIIAEALKADRDPRADLLKVFEASKEVSLLQYRKPSVFSRQYHTLYENQSNIWGDTRMGLFRDLWVGTPHQVWRNTRAREDDESEGYILNNNFLLELVAKLPRTFEDVAKLRKRFTRKTADCMSEILGFIARVEQHIRREEREPDSVPARLSMAESLAPAKPSRLAGVNELKPDPHIEEMVFIISSIDVRLESAKTEKKSKKKADPAHVFLQHKPHQHAIEAETFSQANPSLFHFDSHLDFLRALYPNVDIQPPQKTSTKAVGAQEAAPQLADLREVEAVEFIGINDKQTKIVEDVKELDILEKMYSSKLPESLKEKFKVDLLKKKKRDKTERIAEAKQPRKFNETDAKAKEIFTKGNVFDVLKSRDADEMSEEEDAPAAAETKTFWDVYKEVTDKQNAPNSGRPQQGPRVGEVGGGWAGPKKKKEQQQKKKGMFSQPSIRNVVKF